jgi:DNA-binding transcriptional MerR regulator
MICSNIIWYKKIGYDTFIMKTTPVYAISIASLLIGAHQQTLRGWDRDGILVPARSPGGTRLYSEADVALGQLILRAQRDYGMNHAGIRQALEARGIVPAPSTTDQPLVAARS